ncbi:hypothetical protein FA95DRAFT_1563358 [Auriscalpium vulgare]|uniref:Uncharacterized protein n=1 Tax=Auriscalpium vulgare TaxID=40419 RepID=A0ACB8RGN8_9AGAM|nr:hypothetical protein FA95DRAFT_1563358 [Auriscalpium vulgare]
MPVATLPPECDVHYTHKPLLLHYGLGTSEKQLVAYARRHGLIAQEHRSFYLAAGLGLVPALHRLKKVANARLRIQYPEDRKHTLMISLYSNYTMDDEQYEPPHEEEVLDILRQELQIEGQPAMWFFDRRNPWY